MIIERITSVRVIPPKVVVTRVPVGRISHEVESIHTVASSERLIPGGATGTTLDVSYNEVEVDFSSPRDMIVYARQSQIRPR